MSDKDNNTVSVAIIGCLLLAIGVLLGSIGTVVVLRSSRQPVAIAAPTQAPVQVPTIVANTESSAASTKEYPGSILIDIPKELKPEDARLMRNILRRTLNSGEWEEVEWQVGPIKLQGNFAPPELDDRPPQPAPTGQEIKLTFRSSSPLGKRLSSQSIRIQDGNLFVADSDNWFAPTDRKKFE